MPRNVYEIDPKFISKFKDNPHTCGSLDDIQFIVQEETNHPTFMMGTCKKEWAITKKYEAYKEFTDRIAKELKEYSHRDWVDQKWCLIDYNYCQGLDRHIVKYVVKKYREKGWKVKKSHYFQSCEGGGYNTKCLMFS